jgi:hypothetical protein
LRRKNNASYTTFPIAAQEVLNRLIDLARESPEASLAYDLHRQGWPLAECLFGAMELAYRELKMRRETEMYERLAAGPPPLVLKVDDAQTERVSETRTKMRNAPQPVTVLPAQR